MMRTFNSLSCIGLVALLATSISNAGSINTPTNCVDMRPALRAAGNILIQRYVIPEEGKRGGSRIAQVMLHKAEYEVCGDVDAQANRLTQILREAIPDWHLRVSPGLPPAKHSEIKTPTETETEPDDRGIAEVSRLAEGVGYLRITEFDDVLNAAPRLAHAMALLENVRGLIIDVRGNPGGDGNTVDLIIRSLLPAEAPVTLIKQDRNGKSVDKPPHLPSWKRFPMRTKVVVLIDRGSASAAEVLAFSLKEEGRATIIGTRSLGAAHEVDDAVSLPGNFSLFIPEFRFSGRKSGTDRERKGVVPDIVAVGQDALLLAWKAAK